MAISVSTSSQDLMSISNNWDDELQLKDFSVGDVVPVQCVLKNVNLAPGHYRMSLYVGTQSQDFDHVIYCLDFQIEQGETFIKRPMAYNSNFRTVLQSKWTSLK